MFKSRRMPLAADDTHGYCIIADPISLPLPYLQRQMYELIISAFLCLSIAF